MMLLPTTISSIRAPIVGSGPCVWNCSLLKSSAAL